MIKKIISSQVISFLTLVMLSIGAFAKPGLNPQIIAPVPGPGNTTVLNRPVSCPAMLPANLPAPTSGGLWQFGGNGKDLPGVSPGSALSSSIVDGSGGGGKANLLWCGYFKKGSNQQSIAESYLVFSCGKTLTAPVMPKSATINSVTCP
jgi:hypothetical protein